jgi:hypothetical protein
MLAHHLFNIEKLYNEPTALSNVNHLSFQINDFLYIYLSKQ